MSGIQLSGVEELWLIADGPLVYFGPHIQFVELSGPFPQKLITMAYPHRIVHLAGCHTWESLVEMQLRWIKDVQDQVLERHRYHLERESDYLSL